YFYDRDGKSLGDAWIRTADSSFDALQQYAIDASHGIVKYQGEENVWARPKNDDTLNDATKWRATVY
ncbi:MAG: hypothetical protein II497_00185, partial [Lachnospiraceae bacterium]|nr:hypothetical protein [Lachnospiraceae bacterium]